MKVFIEKEDGKLQWSGATRIQVYLMLIFVYAAQLICNRLTRLFTREGEKGTFIQESKMNLNRAVDCGKEMVKRLQVAFDSTLDKTCSGENNRWSVLQSAANEFVRLCAAYQSRKDASDDPKGLGAAIQSAIMKFDGDKEYDINEDIWNYYK